MYTLLLAGICIIAAIYTFDLHSFNNSLSAVLLVILAYLTVSKNDKIKRYIRGLGYTLAIILIIKVLIIG